MTVALVIDGKKYKFGIEFGWFDGSEFMLFDFRIFNFYAKGSVILVQLQIAKFIIGLYASD